LDCEIFEEPKFLEPPFDFIKDDFIKGELFQVFLMSGVVLAEFGEFYVLKGDSVFV
jgi:hypothetical protein